MFRTQPIRSFQSPASRPPATLVKSAYRTLLKEASFFDTHPLAKALLSASPFLRKDCSWVSVVNQSTHTSTMSEFCGVSSNTLAMPSPKTMSAFVHEEFRHTERAWNGERFFAWIRRMELAKQLHERCSVAIAPDLPPMKAKLQLETAATCAAGTMLFAHPVLVDDFAQAVVLLTATDSERTSGFTLNAPCDTAGFLLEAKRLNALIQSSSLKKAVQKTNVKFFSPWPIFSGGPIQSLPVVLHCSKKIAKAADAVAKKLTKKIVNEDHILPTLGAVHGGWFVQPLFHILTLDPKLVKKELSPKHSRIVMNYSDWETSTLQREITQNWWLATEADSSSAALSSLLEHPSPSDACEDGSGKVMWQRGVANLGGDLSDFSRLTIVQEEDGDYRRLISSTFKDDMKTVQQVPPAA